MKKWQWRRKKRFKQRTCRCSKKMAGRPHVSGCICKGYGTRPTVKARLWWRDKGRLDS